MTATIGKLLEMPCTDTKKVRMRSNHIEIKGDKMVTSLHGFAGLFCMLWILLNHVNSEHFPITGAVYKRQENFVNQLPSQIEKNIVQNLHICSALCQSKSCNGFFYSNSSKICTLIENDASTYQMVNMLGAFYYKKQDPNSSVQSFNTGVTSSPTSKTTHAPFPFTRSLEHEGYLANEVDPTGPSGIALGDCATSCSDAECVGFFYDMKVGTCFPTKTYFLTSFFPASNMTYYKRKVNVKSKLVTLGFNICPPFKSGEIVIKMFNGENYKIFVDTDQVKQSVAANRCKQRHQQLLRMKDKIHHDYIQKLLSCPGFVGKEIWIGAKKIGDDWKFPDQDDLEESYFCPNTPNEPDKQFCVRFLKGCLDDNECDDRVNFICD